MAFMRPATLAGHSVALEPLSESHRESLRLCAGDPFIWTYFPLLFNGEGEHFDAWFDRSLHLSETSQHYPFAVRGLADDSIIGTTRFYDMVPEHLRLAIGSTWYVGSARGTLINSEVRFLTLRFAFEALQVNRVELITDPRNVASHAAMKILGAVQEGVIRSHMIYRDGRVRDSILFSIVRSEWPNVRQRLQARLGYLEDSSDRGGE